MLVTQLHSLVNTVTQEVLGSETVVNEDLSNIVDIGNAIIDSNSVDNYVKKLVDHIGKVTFVNRAYAGGVPSVLMDSWEFGSVLQKIATDLPEAQENSSWDLTDGQEYSQDEFKAPNVSAKFYNKRVTFEIQMSFTEKQLKSAFSSAEQLNGFVSMLNTSVENSMTVKLDSLIMRAINNMIGITSVSDSKGVRAINLLESYNVERGQSLTADKAINDKDFIQYATYKMGVVSDRMTKISSLFNGGGQSRFTPKDLQNVVLLSDFAKASQVYLQSGTFHKEDVALPNHDTVPFWQGSGDDYSFDKISSIEVKTSAGDTVQLTGIIGTIFDKESVIVCNVDKRTTTAYNARAEFFNNWFKADTQYINDQNENFVFFYVADTVTP